MAFFVDWFCFVETENAGPLLTVMKKARRNGLYYRYSILYSGFLWEIRGSKQFFVFVFDFQRCGVICHHSKMRLRVLYF